MLQALAMRHHSPYRGMLKSCILGNIVECSLTAETKNTAAKKKVSFFSLFWKQVCPTEAVKDCRILLVNLFCLHLLKDRSIMLEVLITTHHEIPEFQVTLKGHLTQSPRPKRQP